jgi:hypothetical protein
MMGRKSPAGVLGAVIFVRNAKTAKYEIASGRFCLKELI